MGSIDQLCSSSSFTWFGHIIWTPGINYTGRQDDPDCSACAWCILLSPLGLTPTWVLVLSHLPHITPWLYWFPYRVFDAARVKYRKGTYSVTIVTSVSWDMRSRALQLPTHTLAYGWQLTMQSIREKLEHGKLLKVPNTSGKAAFWQSFVCIDICGHDCRWW